MSLQMLTGEWQVYKDQAKKPSDHMVIGDDGAWKAYKIRRVGVPIARSLAAQHHGKFLIEGEILELKFEGYDQGDLVRYLSAVTVFLPVGKAGEAMKAAEKTINTAKGIKRAVVLGGGINKILKIGKDRAMREGHISVRFVCQTVSSDGSAITFIDEGDATQKQVWRRVTA